jgi:hypothetical protein
MSSYSKYSPEVRERAVRMVAETRSEYSSEGAAIAAVASICGIRSPDTLRKWVRSECSNTRCKTASKPQSTCTYKCAGAFHGSARNRSGQRKIPVETQPVSPRKPKTLQKGAITVAAVAVVGIWFLTLSGTLGGSVSGGNNLPVQVKVDAVPVRGETCASAVCRSPRDHGG